MALALIGLGANLGDRAATLQQVLQRFRGDPQLGLRQHSRLLETPAAGGPANQPAFLNAAATLETDLSPHQLRDRLVTIEQALGRHRTQRWQARTVDLDLLLYEQLQIHDSILDVPHPRMVYRRFVLQPAAEIAGDMRHPEIGWTVAQLLAHLDRSDPYVSVCGPAAQHTSRLLAACCQTGSIIAIPDPAAAGDSPSPPWRSPIELVTQRAELVRRDRFAEQSSLRRLSDFWWQQPPAAPLDTRQQRAWDQVVVQWQNRVSLPRVVVLWAPDGRQQVWREQCLARLAKSQEAPWYVLNTEDLARAVDEVTAIYDAG